MTDFQRKLACLDAVLTGKYSADVVHTAKFNAATPEMFAFGDSLYYLSDGGYSRIGYNNSAKKLFLTSESLERPKASWALCECLIASIEADIASAVETTE
jgi:hypothetical protein